MDEKAGLLSSLEMRAKSMDAGRIASGWLGEQVDTKKQAAPKGNANRYVIFRFGQRSNKLKDQQFSVPSFQRGRLIDYNAVVCGGTTSTRKDGRVTLVGPTSRSTEDGCRCKVCSTTAKELKSPACEASPSGCPNRMTCSGVPYVYWTAMARTAVIYLLQVPAHNFEHRDTGVCGRKDRMVVLAHEHDDW